MRLPSATARLFPAGHQLRLPEDRAALIERLLEEGDGDDLTWLVDELGEAALADWLAERGGRRLSRRSRAFWERVLGAEAGPSARIAEELWPL